MTLGICDRVALLLAFNHQCSIDHVLSANMRKYMSGFPLLTSKVLPVPTLYRQSIIPYAFYYSSTADTPSIHKRHTIFSIDSPSWLHLWSTLAPLVPQLLYIVPEWSRLSTVSHHGPSLIYHRFTSVLPLLSQFYRDYAWNSPLVRSCSTMVYYSVSQNYPNIHFYANIATVVLPLRHRSPNFSEIPRPRLNVTFFRDPVMSWFSHQLRLAAGSYFSLFAQR